MAKRKTRAEIDAAKNIRELKKVATSDYKSAVKDANIARKALKKQLAELAKADKERLRAFRRKVAKLKKAGIIKNIDPRSATITTKLQKKVDLYKDVAEGRAVLRKAPKTTRDKARSVGMRTFGDRVVVPKIKGERVYVSKKDGQIYKRLNRGGSKLKVMPVLERATDWETWARQQKDIMGDEGGEYKTNRYYGFNMFGHNGYAILGDIDKLITYLVKYSTTVDSSPEELLDNLVIIEMTKDEMMRQEAINVERKRQKRLNKKLNKNKLAKLERHKERAMFQRAKEAGAKDRAKKAAEKIARYRAFQEAAARYNAQKAAK